MNPYIHFRAPNSWSYAHDMLMQDQMQLSTMGPFFEEGGSISIPPGNMLTSYANGEEGGGWDRPPEASTAAIGEEGGGWDRPPEASTRAIGEEGGGWDRPPEASTAAIGEEGGGWDNPRISWHSHEDGGNIPPTIGQSTPVGEYVAVVKAADRDGDGRASWEELNNYANGNYIKPAFLTTEAQETAKKREAIARKMVEAFDRIDGSTAGPSFIGNSPDRHISVTDITETAWKDNNPNDISDRDLGIGTAWRGQPPPSWWHIPKWNAPWEFPAPRLPWLTPGNPTHAAPTDWRSNPLAQFLTSLLGDRY